VPSIRSSEHDPCQHELRRRAGGPGTGETAAFTIYWRIILPLLKPAIATVVIIKGIRFHGRSGGGR
jgi:hypothetical protein